MTRFIFTFLILIFSLTNSLKASHDIGGEIWWECLSNGKFVFHANLFRDCSGIPHYYAIKTLKVNGNPLPRRANNSVISSINLIPDSASWLSQNRGDLSPDCNDVKGMIVDCSSVDYGAYQSFPYKSNPINLNGTPPALGWRFSIEQPCCRPNLRNLASQGQSILSAIMYPNNSNDPTNNCYNSSPEFAEKLDYFSCTGTMKYVNHAVLDAENDSVVYTLDRTWNAPAYNPSPIYYSSGYFIDRPTPQANFDSSSVGSVLDSSSGILSYKIGPNYNGVKFWVVIRADEYRGGTRISSTFREYPIIALDCPNDTIINAVSKISPAVAVDGVYRAYIEDNSPNIKLKAGQKLSIGLSSYAVDSLSNNGYSSSSITNNFKISSSQFSRSLSDSTLCQEPPCAGFVMNNQTNFDSSLQAFVGSSNSSNLGTINWETNCSHLSPTGGGQVYQFNIETTTQQQLCDTIITVSGMHTINVEVSNDSNNSAVIPDLKCVNMVSTSDNMVLTWDTAGIPKDSFSYWSIFSSRPNGQFELVDTLQLYYLGSIYGYSTHRFNEVEFKRLDSSFMPEVFIQANMTNCSYIIQSTSSDTLSNYITLEQINNQLVVKASPAFQSYYTYVWKSCNPQTGQTDSLYAVGGNYFTPPDTGYYSVGLFPGDWGTFCGGGSECVFYSPVGLEEKSLKNRVKAYPNPSNGIVNIENLDKEFLYLKVYNIQGKLTQEKSLRGDSYQLQIEGEEGLYFFTLTNESGEQATYKIVKQ